MTSGGLSSQSPVKKSTDTFGCSLGNLATSQQVSGGHIDFYRKSSAAAPPGQVSTPACDRGFLIGLSLRGGHRRRVWKEHHSASHDFDENSLYVRSFSDTYRAELTGSFDFILMEISSAALAQISDGADASGVSELIEAMAEPDPLASGMARSLFAAMGRGNPPNTLMIEQLSAAIGIHLVHKYGNGRLRSGDRRQHLSPTQEARSKELLRSRLDGRVSIEDMASDCDLSQRAFLTSFRQTTGTYPAEWLANQRMEQAFVLLRQSTLSLLEISAACGFSDISEFKLAFQAATGLAPDDWRQVRRS
jgi:AraC-like DNA-binding protein